MGLGEAIVSCANGPRFREVRSPPIRERTASIPIAWYFSGCLLSI
jgi:hypothetical protein